MANTGSLSMVDAESLSTNIYAIVSLMSDAESLSMVDAESQVRSFAATAIDEENEIKYAEDFEVTAIWW